MIDNLQHHFPLDVVNINMRLQNSGNTKFNCLYSDCTNVQFIEIKTQVRFKKPFS